MAGVIWLVQLVIYPQFRQVGAEAFPLYHQHYTGLVTLVVGPLMLIELVSALVIVAQWHHRPSRRLFAWTGLAVVLLLWLVTVLVQVPLHQQLATGFQETLADSLVLGNWIRTVLWTIRVAIAWAILNLASEPLSGHADPFPRRPWTRF